MVAPASAKASTAATATRPVVTVRGRGADSATCATSAARSAAVCEGMRGSVVSGIMSGFVQSSERCGGRGESVGEAALRPRETGFHGAHGQAKGGSSLAIAEPLEHAQGDDLAISEGQLAQGRTRGSVVVTVGVISHGLAGRQLGEQGAVPAGAAAEVLGDPRGGDEQPGQQRPLDEAGISPTAPRLQEGDRDGVIGIGGHGDEPHYVPLHAISVPVEDAAEGLTAPLLCQCPIHVVARALGRETVGRRDAHTL